MQKHFTVIAAPVPSRHFYTYKVYEIPSHFMEPAHVTKRYTIRIGHGKEGGGVLLVHVVISLPLYLFQSLLKTIMSKTDIISGIER